MKHKKYFIVALIFMVIAVGSLFVGLWINPGWCLLSFFINWLISMIFVGMDNEQYKDEKIPMDKNTDNEKIVIKIIKKPRYERHLPGI